MKKGAIIAVAALFALLAAAGIMLMTKNKDSPPVRIIEDSMDADLNTTSDTNDNANEQIIL